MIDYILTWFNDHDDLFARGAILFACGALLITVVVVVCALMFDPHAECNQIAETTGFKTQYHSEVGCFVNIDNQWVLKGGSK